MIYFTSVFNVEPSAPLVVFLDQVGTIRELLQLEISESDVQSKLLNLDPGKSPGPDSIYPRILKYCAHAITPQAHGTFIMSSALQKPVHTV